MFEAGMWKRQIFVEAEAKSGKKVLLPILAIHIKY